MDQWQPVTSCSLSLSLSLSWVGGEGRIILNWAPLGWMLGFVTRQRYDCAGTTHCGVLAEGAWFHACKYCSSFLQ